MIASPGHVRRRLVEHATSVVCEEFSKKYGGFSEWTGLYGAISETPMPPQRSAIRYLQVSRGDDNNSPIPAIPTDSVKTPPQDLNLRTFVASRNASRSRFRPMAGTGGARSSGTSPAPCRRAYRIAPHGRMSRYCCSRRRRDISMMRRRYESHRWNHGAAKQKKCISKLTGQKTV